MPDGTPGATKVAGDVVITLMEADDLPALEAGFAAAHAHYAAAVGRPVLGPGAFAQWQRGYNKARGTSRAVFAARTDGEIVGFVEGVMQLSGPTQPPERLGRVAHLWVSDAMRRRGVASALVGQVREWFAGRRVDAQLIEIYAGNAGAERFWAALGFAPFYSVWRADGHGHAPTDET